ncbi:hypothetical protein PAI11_37740 [Patulibacter medicamentivorans]|uniref:Holin n=1 Tax=Patulibacter medicamentivorans TaxID=1097667 RepID=H0EAA0_9ACTN|nr:hypothetical protein [Patulibacter medicamentivorans]EHN09440.1 hypothetical protein PAI11_37740 [Patulibacter medicamentivorans]
MPTIRSASQAATINHPTGLAAAAATVLVWLAGVLGLDLPPAVAAAIVGLAAAAVSAWTPRFDAAVAVADNDPAAGGTGPDELGG